MKIETKIVALTVLALWWFIMLCDRLNHIYDNLGTATGLAFGFIVLTDWLKLTIDKYESEEE